MCTNAPIGEVLTGLVFYRLSAGGLHARNIPIDGAIRMFIDDVANDQLNKISKSLRKRIYWEVYSHIHHLVTGDLFAIELVTPYHSDSIVRGISRPRVQGGNVFSMFVTLDNYCHPRVIEDQHFKAAGRRRACCAIEQVTGVAP